MMPFVGFSRTTGTAIGPGLELQSGRAFKKLTTTTEEPLLVFNSFGVWGEAVVPDSARIATAIRTALCCVISSLSAQLYCFGSAAGAAPRSSGPIQSPAHSLVPLTVPTNLQPIGSLGFTGLVPALGAAS